mmetsp:Transcript_5013/g.20631  ORF Transcript_5013/g.20631 Transcript_5013/m.20631 type:complete len:329 (-) Transcript_5013:91-1077(-)
MPILSASQSNAASRFVSMARPIPSRITKSASSTVAAKRLDTLLKSITGRSLPLEHTLMAPHLTASANVSSSSATRGRRSSSSSAVTSLMLGTSFAASTTAHPRRASSRAMGSIPSTTSAPELSTNMTHFLHVDASSPPVAPFAVQAWCSESKSSTSHGLDLSLARVDRKSEPPSSCSFADAAAPRSKMLPANAPWISARSRSFASAMVSISARTDGKTVSARSFSVALTSLKQSVNPSDRSVSSRSLHIFSTVGWPSNRSAWSPAWMRSSAAEKSSANRSARDAASGTRGSPAARFRNSGIDLRKTSTHSDLPGGIPPFGSLLPAGGS